MNLFAVIMPTWNRAQIIKRSINSVLSQTCKDFELVIVDDASTDNTEKIITELKDSRIRYTKLEKHQGASACRNVGINSSSSELITFLDSDDTIYENCLIVLKTSFEREQWDVAYCNVEAVHGESVKIYSYGFNKRRLASHNYIPNVGLTHVRELVNKVKWNETLKRLQDWDYWCQLARHADFFHIDECLGRAYLYSDGSISRTDESNQWYNEARKYIVSTYQDLGKRCQ